MSKRLIGSDGKLTIGSFGTELIAAATLVADKWYLVTGIDGSASVFPVGAVVGYMYKAEGGEVLGTADKAKLWTSTDMCDVQSWGLDFSKDSVDVTTFCDNARKKRAGKTDVTGSCEGVFTTGVTSVDGGFQNQFMTIVRQNPDGVSPADYVVSVAEGETMMVQLYADKNADSTGEIEAFYWAPIELTGFSASAGGEDAQAFSAPFVIAPSTEAQFAYYEFTVPAP